MEASNQNARPEAVPADILAILTERAKLSPIYEALAETSEAAAHKWFTLLAFVPPMSGPMGGLFAKASTAKGWLTEATEESEAYAKAVLA